MNFTMHWHMSSGGKWLIKFLRGLPNWRFNNKTYGVFHSIHQVPHIKEMLAEFPNLKIVHLVRDGLELEIIQPERKDLGYA